MSGPYVAAVYQGHDASVAVVGNGKIVHLEHERFTRERHATGDCTADLLPKACALMGVDPKEISAIAGISGALSLAPSFWESAMDLVETEPRTIAGIEAKGYSMPHHACHAAYAFYTSPFKAARIFAMDGGGDSMKLPMWKQYNLSIDCFTGQGAGEKLHLEWVPTSWVGGMWHNASNGVFDKSHCEGKLMALVGVPEDRWGETGLSPDLRDEFVRMQALTNVRFRQLLPHNFGAEPLVMAGGCALNGIATYDLLKNEMVKRIHVPPSVDDGGITVGACLYLLHQVMGVPRFRFMPEDIAFCGWTDPELEGEPPIEQIAALLARGQTVALAHGKAESGPRALGHRSILADPRPRSMKDRINAIKGREKYRPVAPVILREYAEEYFNLIDPTAYSFMTMICDAKQRMKDECPAGVHYDGTARVQVVDKGTVLGDIIEAFRQITGVPVVLNTSFNIGGEAICNDAAQARDTFARSSIDALCVGSELTVR